MILTKEETCIVEYGFVWCWNLETSESVSEMLGKFWYVVLEKDGEDQLGRSYEKLTITQSQGRKEYTVRSKGSRTEFFYRFPTNAIYRAAIEPCSWNSFSQECKLALV